MAKVSKIEQVDIDKLIPYVNNAKIHTEEQVLKIASSIREFGFLSPVLIDKDYNIIAGHGRVMAAKKIDMSEVPCVYVEGLTEAQKKAYILADNRLGDIADWDMELVNSELEQLMEMDFDIDLTGFDFSLEQEVEAIQDDYDGDIPKEPKAKLGDIYKLGDHTLMCGDSTNIDDVNKLIGGRAVDLVMTDPPYDMDMGGQGCFKSSMQNCKDRIDDIIRFDPYVLSYLPNMDIHSFYIFTSKNGISKYLDIFKDLNYDILCWCKTNPVPFTSGSFLPDVEYMLYFSRKGRIWNDSLKPTSVYKKYYVTQKLQGRIDGGGDLHPTMKPIEIIVDKILINSSKDGYVLDIFGGSGTTMIACEQTNRNCLMMELSPAYVDVIIDRWEKFTGKKAVLING